MQSGAKGCQVIISGKLTGERHRTEKFTEGHVKYCGETALQVMDVGFSAAKLKPGILGVKIRIMRPDAKLPDEVIIKKPGEPVAVTAETKPTEKKESEKPADATAAVGEEKITPLKKIIEIPGVGPSLLKKLEKAGIKSLEELFEMDMDDVLAIEGIGKKTAENLIKNLKKALEEGE